MARQINITDSVTVNPSGYTGLTSLTTNTNYPVTNGYANASSTTYARFTLSSGATGYLYFTFDTSAVPEAATITSITGIVKVRVSSTSTVTNTKCQLYTNTTAKGNNVTFASTSSSNTVSISATNAGSWTRSELTNLRLRIGGTGASSSGGGSSSRYIYFYGANIVINYSLNGYEYTIAASSTLNNLVPTPTSQDIFEGNNAEIRIDGNSLTDVVVTDNDTDITELLVQHDNPAGSFSPTFIPSSFDSTNSSYNSIYNNNNPENGCTDASSSTRCCAYSNTTNGSTSELWYNFDCSSIPANAIINSVTCVVGASCYSSGSYFSTRELQLFVGTTTPKGTAVTVTGNGATAAQHNVNGGTSWTRVELDNLKIRFQVIRSQTGDASFSFFGATLTVNYSIPAENPYYWTYSLTNVQADHIILIDTAGVYIPPEEDPEYTYHSITISSINASTDPSNGTTRVVEGSNQTITIYPSDPQLTLALDNGVDITSQLQGGLPTNTYTITTQVSGASYRFTLNNNTGYYVSTNNGVAKSASVARINMDFESSCVVTIQYINYAEANYDYGMFGKLDTAVATDGLTASSSSSSPSDSTSNYQLAMASNSSSAQTITYTVPAGQHFIDVKYGKDDATDSNNDTLQWKVLSVEATSGSGNYTYTLSNVQANHSLVFVFGNVNYYFVTSSGTGCRIFPDGQMVKLPGQSYNIKIVPDNITDTVVLTDNNVEQILEREDGYDKDNNPAVSYSYSISAVNAAHTIVVTSTIANNDYLYIKQNGSWVQIIKVYEKINGSWVQQNLSYMSDNNLQYLKQG